MRGDKSQMRPIMSMSDNIRRSEFGPNAYTKPSSSAQLYLERPSWVLSLFDQAFKEYSERWAFKHPKPAELFQDDGRCIRRGFYWFWRGWFYTNDNVDVNLDEVKWFKLSKTVPDPERKGVKAKQGDLSASSNPATDFSGGPQPFTLSNTPDALNGEFKTRFDDNAIRAKLSGKNIYQLKFVNVGGLVTPMIIEWTYKDGTKEIEKIPAGKRGWRVNENVINKVFYKG